MANNNQGDLFPEWLADSAASRDVSRQLNSDIQSL